MEKFTLKDNTVVDYVILEPSKQQLGFFPKEESQQFSSREYNFNGTSNVEETRSVPPFVDVVAAKTISTTLPVYVDSERTGTNYIGAVKFNVPHLIQETFTDFKLMDILGNPIATLSSSAPESLTTSLFPDNDGDPKVTTLFNGLQALRIPINRFNDTTGTTVVKKFGKYYIKVSPKYVDTPITDIILRRHDTWSQIQVAAAIPETRRQVIKTDNNVFLQTPWSFESNPFQIGRLYGSVVEIWNASTTIKKQQKFIADSDLGLGGTTGKTSLVLYPDNMGYDPASQVATVGDVLRIYPRETYFDPIYIEVDYQDVSSDITALVQFMKNDVVRNLENGVFEVYDNSGVDISTGIPEGNVIQSYQVISLGNFEVRKRLNS